MRISDWSSDVCSSDLDGSAPAPPPETGNPDVQDPLAVILVNLLFNLLFLPEFTIDDIGLEVAETKDEADRKSVVKGKRVSVRVDLGGRRILKKKKKPTDNNSLKHYNTIKTQPN